MSQTPDELDLADKYEQMLRLADLFDTAGDDLRARARLGDEVLRDEAVTESAELSPLTYRTAEDEIRGATTGPRGLLTRGVELDADALMVRATVLTYRWIDDLAEAAHRTMGSIASRAIGYLAPEVELGGAIVAAGLIETDSLDRHDVTGYLSELAEQNPELLDHLTSGGGGLLESLQLRALLTASVLAGDSGRMASLGGLRAIGVHAMTPDFGSALRDAAGGFVTASPEAGAPDAGCEPHRDHRGPAWARGADGDPRRVTGQHQRPTDLPAPLHRLPARPRRPPRPAAAGGR